MVKSYLHTDKQKKTNVVFDKDLKNISIKLSEY